MRSPTPAGSPATDLLDAAEAADVKLPGAVSISRRLIEGWYGAELPGRW